VGGHGTALATPMMQHSNTVNHKEDNEVVDVGRLNFPMVNKPVTGEELAASTCRHCSTATVDHLSEVVKKHTKGSITFLVFS